MWVTGWRQGAAKQLRGGGACCEGRRRSRSSTATTPEARHVATRPSARNPTLGLPSVTLLDQGPASSPAGFLGRRSRRMHPPRDVKQLLPPVGAERGVCGPDQGLRRADLRRRASCSSPKCRAITPNPANTRGPNPLPYAELLGLQPTLPYRDCIAVCMAGQSATLRVRHWVGGISIS